MEWDFVGMGEPVVALNIDGGKTEHEKSSAKFLVDDHAKRGHASFGGADL